MVRKQFYIERCQDTLLKQAAKETGLTEAEIIRQALDLWADCWRARNVRQEERAFIQSLIAKGPASGRRTSTRGERDEERLCRDKASTRVNLYSHRP